MPVTLEPVARKSPLITLVIPPEQLARLDERRFTDRFHSRAEAIKWMLEWCENILESGRDCVDDLKPPRP